MGKRSTYGIEIWAIAGAARSRRNVLLGAILFDGPKILRCARDDKKSFHGHDKIIFMMISGIAG